MARSAILVVTERPLFPADEGSRVRIRSLVRSLRELGFRVVLVARRPSRLIDRLRMRRIVDALTLVDARGFAGGSPSDYDCGPFREAVRDAVDRFSPVAVIAEYIWMAPCLDAVSNGALRLVDTHDVMHAAGDAGHALDRPWATCTADEERRLLDRADVIIAIQPHEQRRFRELLPGKAVICVAHHVPVRPAPVRSRQPVVGFISAGHPRDVDALTSFLEMAWPVVRQRCPMAELRIFGKLARQVAVTEHVIRRGYRRSLRRVYGEASVVINPVRFGTGLKIKSVEALAHGKALVTTSSGAQGLETGAGRAFLVEDDLVRFGELVSDLLSDHAARLRLESAALTFAQTEFSRERVYADLVELLCSRAAAVRVA
jgi:glycosyltransferase involved in cell wall biosynthesis